MATLKAKIDSAWVTVGGPGPGVAAGGTPGQLLAKTSASDYDTQWITPANGLPPGGATNAILAKTSASDYAAGWTSTPTLADLTLTGTLTSKHAVRAACGIDGSTGAIVVPGFGVTSCTRVSAGVYSVQLSASYTAPIPSVVLLGNAHFTTLFAAQAVSGSSIAVHANNPSGTPIDAWFYLTVVSA